MGVHDRGQGQTGVCRMQVKQKLGKAAALLTQRSSQQQRNQV